MAGVGAGLGARTDLCDLVVDLNARAVFPAPHAKEVPRPPRQQGIPAPKVKEAFPPPKSRRHSRPQDCRSPNKEEFPPSQPEVPLRPLAVPHLAPAPRHHPLTRPPSPRRCYSSPLAPSCSSKEVFQARGARGVPPPHRWLQRWEPPQPPVAPLSKALHLSPPSQSLNQPPPAPGRSPLSSAAATASSSPLPLPRPFALLFVASTQSRCASSRRQESGTDAPSDATPHGAVVHTPSDASAKPEMLIITLGDTDTPSDSQRRLMCRPAAGLRGHVRAQGRGRLPGPRRRRPSGVKRVPHSRHAPHPAFPARPLSYLLVDGPGLPWRCC